MPTLATNMIGSDAVTIHFDSKFTEKEHSGASRSRLKLANDSVWYNATRPVGHAKLNDAKMDRIWRKSWFYN